jgi:hypothetical protein
VFFGRLNIFSTTFSTGVVAKDILRGTDILLGIFCSKNCWIGDILWLTGGLRLISGKGKYILRSSAWD